MNMNQETIDKINEVYKAKRYDLNLRIDNSLKGVSIFNDNWAITTLDELTNMINELTMLRDSVATVTGITF